MSRILTPQLSWIFVFWAVAVGCSEQNVPALASSEDKTSAPYVPPQGYQPSQSDPLAALYGGKIPEAGETTQGSSRATLTASFERSRSLELNTLMPSTWRRSFIWLKSRAKLKVQAWTSREITRMEDGKRDADFSISFQLLGPRSAIKTQLLEALRKIPNLPELPQQWGDQHEHESSRGAQALSLTLSSRSDESAQDDRWTLMTVELTSRLRTPTAETKLKNCRYVHALREDYSAHVPEWASKHFKSTSTRRFVAWEVTANLEGTVWRATWLYRNGAYRDTAIGWWTQQLERQKATQTALRGLEQTWRISDGLEISWWPETDPAPMGCEVAGPLLTFSGSL